MSDVVGGAFVVDYACCCLVCGRGWFGVVASSVCVRIVFLFLLTDEGLRRMPVWCVPVERSLISSDGWKLECWPSVWVMCGGDGA